MKSIKMSEIFNYKTIVDHLNEISYLELLLIIFW